MRFARPWRSGPLKGFRRTRPPGSSPPDDSSPSTSSAATSASITWKTGPTSVKRSPIQSPRARRARRAARRRSPAPRLHLLPSGDRARCAGRAHAARGLRAHDRGNRRGLHHARADARAAHRAREIEDPRREHSIRSPRSRGSLRRGSTACCASSTSCSTKGIPPAAASRPRAPTSPAKRSVSAASSSICCPSRKSRASSRSCCCTKPAARRGTPRTAK